MIFNHRNIYVSQKAIIGKNVRIGDNTTIYDNVVIGDNSVIGSNCIIGEPLSSFYYSDDYKNPELKIGANALVRSYSIIYAGSVIGEKFQTGHHVTIRENMSIGKNCSVGTFSDLQGHSVIGDYCRLHSNVHIGQNSKIGNFVFIYPFVVFTNDPHPPSNLCIGATVDDYTQIAVHSVLLPGVKIGKNCLIGANSTVNKNFCEGILIAGTPAKEVGKVDTVKSKEKHRLGESHYPWMNNFERGMPWEGMGFDNWKKDI
jgi:UDP-3-O-[3-hydroxymyristoyl] glucosamine N-acyltransferase